jgi:SAM-dependent methyltransferase
MHSKRNLNFSLDKVKENIIGSLTMVPQNVSYLAVNSDVEMKSTKIEFFWNRAIQHLSIDVSLKFDYYEDYLMTTTYSSTMQKLQEAQSIKLSDLTKNAVTNEITLVEIGCGDGSFLLHASNYFSKVIGIEPSNRFAEEARRQGFEIKEGYVSENTTFGLKNIHAFVSRQVFEHLPDPLDCLLGIRSMLVDGAVGLIEVPNGYKAFKNGNFYEFFPDHINYFSVNSLVSLATTAGFNVISCGESFNGDYLELWVQLNLHHDSWVINMNKTQQIITENIRKWTLTQNKHETAIFGCGAKAISIINQDPHFFSNYFELIIDTDPNKQNKFVPNSSLKVYSLKDQEVKMINSFLILALSYTDEILKQINNYAGDKVNVYTINSIGEVIRLQ